MKLPNFLIIGAAKSGTTSLASYLKQHPQIYISSLKEPHFFAFEGENLDFRGPGDKEVHRSIVTNLDVYTSLFGDVSKEKAIGEASTTSLVVPDAAKRIKHYIPDVKLITILRNPAERAYSSFLHLRRDGREFVEDFGKAIEQEDKRIVNNWGYLWRYKQAGFYYQQLKRYYDLFDDSQIKIYLYEDLRDNSSFLFSDIFNFLDVDKEFVPDTSTKENVSGIPRNRLLHNFLHTKNPVRAMAGPLIPKFIRTKVRAYNLQKPKLSDDIRAELIEVFRSDILKLQSLINRDLSHWLF